MKASDWSFRDGAGGDFSMKSWAGKVLVVNYVDPDADELKTVYEQ